MLESAVPKPKSPVFGHAGALPAGERRWFFILGVFFGELKLDALPVWDGMAAAGGKLFLATKDGAITCYSAKRTASAD